MAIGQGLGTEGPTRYASKTWSPQLGGDWLQSTPNGLNYKYLDADGNGSIEVADFDLTKLHFGKFRNDYLDFDESQPGDDLFMTTSIDVENNVVELGDGPFNIIVKKNPIDNLVGIAFAIAYDTAFFVNGKTLPSNWSACPNYLSGQWLENKTLDGKAHFAVYNAGGLCPLEVEKLFAIALLEPRPVLPGTATTLQFSNIKGLLSNGESVVLGGQDLDLTFSGFEIKETKPEKPGLNIYPNPSDGVFYFQLDQDEVADFRIYDATGRTVDVQPKRHQRDFMLDLSDYASGVYFMQLTRQQSVETWILVVRK